MSQRVRIDKATYRHRISRFNLSRWLSLRMAQAVCIHQVKVPTWWLNKANQILPNQADHSADSSVDVSEFEYEVYVGVILKSVTNGLLICLYKRENSCTIMVDAVAIDDAILNGRVTVMM